MPFNTLPELSGPVAFLQDFQLLGNVIIKFQDFPGFPGPAKTLNLVLYNKQSKINYMYVGDLIA